MKKLQKNVNFFAFKKIDSTNIYAKSLAKNGYTEGTVVLASEQTSGRGRLGRTFLSKRGGLYFSVILRPKKSNTDSVLITAAAAVSAARAIERISDKKCEIKWVNDIYVNNKKVCGILAEGEINPKGEFDYVILGVGINLFEPKQKFPSNLPLADSVFHKNDRKTFKNRAKKRLLKAFLEEFFAFYENLNEKKFMSEYQSRSLLTGKKISYKFEEKEQTATVLGIDEDAKLIIKQGKATKKLSHGEIQIVGMEQLLV